MWGGISLWFWFTFLWWLNGHESEWTPGVGDGQGGLACCDSWGRKKSDMTEQLNWLTDWLMTSDVEYVSYAFWPCVYLLKRNVYLVLLPILKSRYIILCWWVIGVLYVLWILTTYQINYLQIFLPSHIAFFTLSILSFDDKS